jgi:hypothetical protein
VYVEGNRDYPASFPLPCDQALPLDAGTEIAFSGHVTRAWSPTGTLYVNLDGITLDYATAPQP